MGRGANIFLFVGLMAAREALFPVASLAASDTQTRAVQAGEDRWVPSLAIVSGVNIQVHRGNADSFVFEDMSPTPVPLRGFVEGNDVVLAPFVGGSLELMTPALPFAWRPRLFLNVEILPTFASTRILAIEGDPDCVRGPEPDDVCARDEDGSRKRPFGEDSLNGQGTRVSAKIGNLVFAAGLGVAFPVRLGDRELRIKPSIGWTSYEVDAGGTVVHGNCDPLAVCTDTQTRDGFLRETILTASASQRFHGVGPGLDVEMDTGRYGPLGVSLFIGGRAHYIPGDRTISFGTATSFDDQLGMDVAAAQFGVEVDAWMYRAHVGFRMHWLGSRD